MTLERVLARFVLHSRTVRSLEADAMRLPFGATATLFTLPSCSLKRYALKFALKFQSIRQSSSPPLTICFMLGKNAALLMAQRWPRKVRSRVGSIGIVEARLDMRHLFLNSGLQDGYQVPSTAVQECRERRSGRKAAGALSCKGALRSVAAIHVTHTVRVRGVISCPASKLGRVSRVQVEFHGVLVRVLFKKVTQFRVQEFRRLLEFKVPTLTSLSTHTNGTDNNNTCRSRIFNFRLLGGPRILPKKRNQNFQKLEPSYTW
jgi:hypothetical protein